MVLTDTEMGERGQATMRSALILVVAAAAACGDAPGSPVTPPITPIAACPEGAVLVGAAPSAGLRQRCQRSESERHGASREWYDNGRERSYSEWWDGKKHGRFTLWFKNGRVRSEGAHRHGVPAGAWKYFRDDGSLQQQATFPVSPPSADWLAQAMAGHAPAKDEAATLTAAPPATAPTAARVPRTNREISTSVRGVPWNRMEQVGP